MILDPRIGKLDLWSVNGDYDPKIGITVEPKHVKSKEIDFMKERNLLSLFDGTPT